MVIVIIMVMVIVIVMVIAILINNINGPPYSVRNFYAVELLFQSISEYAVHL